MTFAIFRNKVRRWITFLLTNPIDYKIANLHTYTQCTLLLFSVLLVTGCSAFISSATSNLADNLSSAIQDNDDLATVKAGAPAHMLMIDGLLQGDPKNESMLRAAATLYAAYTSVFVNDPVRADKLTNKALRYGFRALCVRRTETCGFRDLRYREFEATVDTLTVEDVPALYTLGVAWAGWIEAHGEDWNAVAEISRVEAIMQRVVELDETYKDGGAYLYLGVLATLLPPSLGGKPDVGRKQFERAIEISKGKNLMAKVSFARQYARMMFDRNLHDQLLKEVLAAEPNVSGYTLFNTLAQQKARYLLDSADEYF